MSVEDVEGKLSSTRHWDVSEINWHSRAVLTSFLIDFLSVPCRMPLYSQFPWRHQFVR